MKEATGELNMTVVTVVAIAAVGAFFYAIIWPTVKDTINSSTKCATAICESGEGRVKCMYYEAGSTEGEDIYCTVENSIN